ncbi:hypothetical protein scyTo_0010165, partial [Scyliorhinus torazame]|nr:hypothetical protein [Scyliorhinus torazame]
SNHMFCDVQFRCCCFKLLNMYLERSLDNLLGLNVPLLILVPAADLPGLEILHVACWLSS